MIVRILRALRKLIYFVFHRSNFAELHWNSDIRSRVKIDGRKNISIGLRAVVKTNSWLLAIADGTATAKLSIRSGASIGRNNHITALGAVIIGERALLANNVYITDNIHEYGDISVPIMDQPIKFKSAVAIGSGAWIGENVCIIGASVGKNSVIGANSVVTSDIPEYCVAVGSPAKIIRKYNHDSEKWEST